MSLGSGLSVLNSPGTIDSDYRGEIKVILINLSDQAMIIEPQMRIAQMVFCPIVIPELCETSILNQSKRQEGGFGHTGK